MSEPLDEGDFTGPSEDFKIEFGELYGPFEESHFYGPACPCFIPTRALPGTEQKIEELIRRADRLQDLWHPQDRPMPADCSYEILVEANGEEIEEQLVRCNADRTRTVLETKSLRTHFEPPRHRSPQEIEWNWVNGFYETERKKRSRRKVNVDG